jgi:methylated-DNA-[protein]-cysteine S-methyltransferase
MQKMKTTKNTIHIQYYQNKQNSYAHFILGSYEGKLCFLDHRYRKKRETVENRLGKFLKVEFEERDNEILKVTRKQLDEYFEGKRQDFDLPILTIGTNFQKSVWNALLQIPYGSTATYKELAKTIGNEKAVRAIANAVGANALGIIIPCHRIIGSDGNLTGYAGGLELKKQLLELEQKFL